MEFYKNFHDKNHKNLFFKIMELVGEMQTFWSHLTFTDFRQPFRTCFAAWALGSTAREYHLCEAWSFTFAELCLKIDKIDELTLNK